MSSKLLIGAGAVLSGDMLGMRLPASLDFGGLPVRQYGASVAGVWLLEKAMGQGVSFMRAAIQGIAAMAAADLQDSLVKLRFEAAGINLARLGAGAVGVWGASKLNLGG